MANSHRHGAFILMRLALLSLAIGVGIVVMGLFLLIQSVSTGADFQIEEGISFLAMQAGLISVPFIVLAMIGIQKMSPWLVGIFLTLLSWGYFSYAVISSWKYQEGVNIGAGLIVLVSPWLITVICLIVARLAEKRDELGHKAAE